MSYRDEIALVPPPPPCERGGGLSIVIVIKVVLIPNLTIDVYCDSVDISAENELTLLDISENAGRLALTFSHPVKVSFYQQSNHLSRS